MACNATWGFSMARIRGGRQVAAALPTHGFDSNLVSPVGLTFKLEVEELPPETSPFHRKPGEKRPIPELTQNGAEVGIHVDKINRLDWSDPGDIIQFVGISVALIFFFWFTNYFVPQRVFKDVFAKAEEEESVNDESTTPPPTTTTAPPPKMNKRYRTFKKKIKENVVIDV